MANLIEPAGLTKWSQTVSPLGGDDAADADDDDPLGAISKKQLRFPVDPVLNAKMILWCVSRPRVDVHTGGHWQAVNGRGCLVDVSSVAHSRTSVTSLMSVPASQCPMGPCLTGKATSWTSTWRPC
jgi:hypothetical protein